MSDRSLPDELRSVLLAHSYDAPDPDDTVARTLAATVDADTLGSSTRHRRRPRPGLLGGVAAGVVLVAVAGGMVALSRDNQGGTGSATSRGAAMRAGDNGAQMAPRSPNLAGPQAGGSAQSLIPSGLHCPGTQGLYSISQTVPLEGEQDRVISAQCVDAAGLRLASQVYTVRSVGGTARVQATLIRPSDGLSVQSVSTGPSEITVRFMRLATDRTPPALEQKTFQTTDGGYSYHTVQASTLAQDCAPDRLDATVVAGPAGLARVLRVTSTDTAACLLSGYPTIGTSTRSLRGPAGGTAQPLAPIVLLEPGQTASAAIDQPRTGNAACSTVLRPPTIQLPDGAVLIDPVVRAGLGCGLQVHPFVAGATGSG